MTDTGETTPGATPRRRAFVDQITAAATACGATVRWHSGDWIAEIESAARRVLVIGQVFPLNSASSAHVATDKVATHSLLTAAGLPAVPHHLLRQPIDPADALRAVLDTCGLPVVLKPHRESSGIDVRRALDEPALRALLAAYATKYRAIAASPWQDIQDEHRVVVLDGAPLLTYRKARPDGPEWRHNLQFGAHPDLDVPPPLATDLHALATAAMRALALRFASVDVVRVDGGLRVLEVNAGVTLEHFTHASPTHRRLADDIYHRAVRASLAP